MGIVLAGLYHSVQAPDGPTRPRYDAEGVLTHLANAGAILEESLKIAGLTRLEMHGPEAELAKLRQPMATLNPQFYALEYGFRK